MANLSELPTENHRLPTVNRAFMKIIKKLLMNDKIKLVCFTLHLEM